MHVELIFSVYHLHFLSVQVDWLREQGVFGENNDHLILGCMLVNR